MKNKTNIQIFLYLATLYLLYKEFSKQKKEITNLKTVIEEMKSKGE